MVIVEKRYRGSVICRVMGYPIAYGIVKLLLEKGEMDLTHISAHVKRTKSAACFLLTKLRLANIIRYDRRGKEAVYWVKYPHEVKRILEACELLARRASERLDTDS